MLIIKENRGEDHDQAVDFIKRLLGIDYMCNFIVVGIDHHGDHAPVMLTSFPKEDLAMYLISLGVAYDWKVENNAS